MLRAFHFDVIAKGVALLSTALLSFRFDQSIVVKESYMDRWLNNAPALAFIKDLSTWLIINSRCEPILWSDDDKELAWLFACVLECGASNQTKLIVNNRHAKNLGEVAVRRTSRAGVQRGAIVLPIRSQ